METVHSFLGPPLRFDVATSYRPRNTPDRPINERQPWWRQAILGLLSSDFPVVSIGLEESLLFIRESKIL
jgi:hypothetical protein